MSKLLTHGNEQSKRKVKLDNSQISLVNLPLAIVIYKGFKPIFMNEHFLEMVGSTEAAKNLLANKRFKQACDEIKITNDSTYFEVSKSNLTVRCIASPVPGDLSSVVIIFENITHNALEDNCNILLYRLSLILSSTSQTIEQKLQLVVDQILFEFDCASCVIYRFDKTDGNLHQSAWGTIKIDLRQNNHSPIFKIGEGIIGKAAKTLKPIVTNNESNINHYVEKRHRLFRGTLLAVPLVSQGKLYGVLMVARDSGLNFTNQSVQIFLTIANRIAMAIENDQIKQEDQRQNALVRQLSGGISTEGQQWENVLANIATLAQVDESFLLYREEKNCKLFFTSHSSNPNLKGLEKGLRALLEEHQIIDFFKDRKHLVIEKQQNTLTDLLAQYGISNGLVFPLVSRHRIYGFLLVSNSLWKRQFEEREINVLANLATQIASVLLTNESHEALLNERNKLDQLVNSLRDGLIYYSLDMRVAQYNNAFGRLVGLKKNIIGMPWELVLSKQSTTYCNYNLLRSFDPVEFLRNAISQGKVSRGIATISTKPPKIIEVTVAPVYDREQRISGVLSHMRDITQVHELQQKTIARVDQLTLLFKISSVAGFNAKEIVRRTLRLGLQLLPVKGISIILMDGDNDQTSSIENVGDVETLNQVKTLIDKRIKNVLKSGKSEAMHLRSDSNKDKVHMLMIPINGRHQSCRGVLVAVDKKDRAFFTKEDIHLLTIVSTQLASKLDTAWLLNQVEADRNKLAAIIEQSFDGIVVLDAESNIQLWNESLERLTGIKEEEVMFRSLSDVRKTVTVVAETKVDNLIEIEMKHKITGKTVWLGVTYSPIIHAGQKTGYVAIIRDVSRQKELERTKNEFISTASHELRSPITAIVGYLSMLKRGDAGRIVNQQQAFFVDKAYQNSKRMVALIEDLLTTTRMETGQVRFQLQAINMVEVIDSILGDVCFKANTKNIKVTIDRDNYASVLADRNGIEQVLNNIINNAIKYTPYGGRVSISFKSKRLDGEPVVITDITDSGVGIDSSDYERIFEKFTRLDSPLSVSAGGTGLGLYITKTIVDNLGGRLTVKSRPGKGSTFSIILPSAKKNISRNKKERSSK